MNTPAAFKQIDVTRAIKGVEQAGLSVAVVDIAPDGRITIRVKDDEASQDKGGWD